MALGGCRAGEVARAEPELVELELERGAELGAVLDEERVLVVDGRGGAGPVRAAGDDLGGGGAIGVVARTIDDGELVVEDLVDVADVDAGGLEATGLGVGARDRVGDALVFAGGLEQEPDLNAARDGIGERGGDRGIGVAVHRDVDRVLRAADHLGDARVVRVGGGLWGEQDIDLGTRGDEALRACVLDERVERGRADVRDLVELGERVELVVVGGPERGIGTVAVRDDVVRDSRGDAGAALQRARAGGAVVDHREDTECLGRALVEAAIGLAVGERIVLAILDLDLVGAGGCEEQR